MIPRADRFTPFESWVDQFRLTVGGSTSIPEWRGGSWRDWVREFQTAADGDVIDVPREAEFNDFETWADDFIRRNEG
jgi:hypothetical protein